MKLKINGLRWTVINLEKDDKQLNPNENAHYLGVTNYRDLTISLDSSQPEELYRRTVIHELVHAFSFSYGVHLIANDSTEEPVCDFMGAHLDDIYFITNKIMSAVYRGG